MEPAQENFFTKLKFFLEKNKSIVIFISVLCVLSFGTTGYLLIANKKAVPPNIPPQKNIVLTPTAIPQQKKLITNILPSSIPIPTVALTDPTVSWRAFASSKYSYSIKYPPNWSAEITVQQDPKILEYVVFNPVATTAGTLSITLSYGNRTYLEGLALDPQIGETILVASVSSTKKNSKDSNGYSATNVIVPFGPNTIIFNAKNTHSSLFNQMLSTLRFTN